MHGYGIEIRMDCMIMSRNRWAGIRSRSLGAVTYF